MTSLIDMLSYSKIKSLWQEGKKQLCIPTAFHPLEEWWILSRRGTFTASLLIPTLFVAPLIVELNGPTNIFSLEYCNNSHFEQLSANIIRILARFLEWSLVFILLTSSFLKAWTCCGPGPRWWPCPRRRWPREWPAPSWPLSASRSWWPTHARTMKTLPCGWATIKNSKFNYIYIHIWQLIKIEPKSYTKFVYKPYFFG